MADNCLFACTTCNARLPFEELSKEDQACKNCQTEPATFSKCCYCRVEFPYKERCGSKIVCPKCTSNLKIYGKPKACNYCRIIAAFIGSLCQRCVNSEKRWGSPHACCQCKQKCAFRRENESRSKLTCWLCAQASKRALAKSRGADISKLVKKTSQREEQERKRKHKRPDGPSAKPPSMEKNVSKKDDARKRAKVEDVFTSSLNGNSNSDGLTEPSLSENMLAIGALKEEVESLKKACTLKDQMILEKEKKITELRAENYEAEKVSRSKLQTQQTQMQTQIDKLQNKVRELQKQVALASKSTKSKVVLAPPIDLLRERNPKDSLTKKMSINKKSLSSGRDESVEVKPENESKSNSGEGRISSGSTKEESGAPKEHADVHKENGNAKIKNSDVDCDSTSTVCTSSDERDESSSVKGNAVSSYGNLLQKKSFGMKSTAGEKSADVVEVEEENASCESSPEIPSDAETKLGDSHAVDDDLLEDALESKTLQIDISSDCVNEQLVNGAASDAKEDSETDMT